MQRKKILLLVVIIGVVSVLSIIGYSLLSTDSDVMGTDEIPFKNLSTDDVASISVLAQPQNTTKIIDNKSQIQEIVKALNAVEKYEERTDTDTLYGQYVQFTLTMKTGNIIEIGCMNPYIKIDGTEYKTKYEPCEELNRLANKLIK